MVGTVRNCPLVVDAVKSSRVGEDARDPVLDPTLDPAWEPGRDVGREQLVELRPALVDEDQRMKLESMTIWLSPMFIDDEESLLSCSFTMRFGAPETCHRSRCTSYGDIAAMKL
jgi:hypothetical protein